MKPENGEIITGSQISTNVNYFTCVREINPSCGDGHIQSGEECDDANDVDDDNCDNTCRRTL